jgi:hypothetical protein
MAEQGIIDGFLSSEMGQKALGELQSQGISADDANTMLSHAAAAAADHVHDHATRGGLLGEHPGRNFFAAFAAGLVKGDGVFGALEDGASGVITGRIAEALVERMGIDGGTAGTVAATATPYVMSFLRSYLGI